jgi:hypothetical protein
MANATPARLGQANQSGADDALFLKQFSGEVMTAFETRTVFMERHLVRSISNGKTAQFPIVGRASAAYHTPGNELLGTGIGQNERNITVDGFLVSHIFTAEIDELMNHYDLRGIYSAETGKALAYALDRNVARVLVLAARGASNLTGEPGGAALAVANMNTVGATLVDNIWNAAQVLDEKDVDSDGRAVALRPAQYHLIARIAELVDKDLTDGNGDRAKAQVRMVANIEIVKSNHVPSADDSANSSLPTAYRGNFSKTVGVVWHPAAAGTLKLQDINTRMSYDERRLGTLIVSKVSVGHGILRPACAVELAIP